MSLEAVLARIGQLQSTFTPPAPAPATAPPSSTTTSFSSALQSAGATGAPATLTAGAPAATLGTSAPSSAGQAILNAVRGEVGVKEQPPGSNDSPRIAQFRQATAGSGVGPWCAYFTSWAARQAGVPLGENGQGFGRVDDVYAWAQRAGKAIPNGGGGQPHPRALSVSA